MFPKILTIFIILPLLELYVIIEVGAVVGALPTILFVVFTAVAGVFLTKLEGLRTLRRMQQQIMLAQMPAEELVDSVLICVAGVLLLTPGFLTDLLGVLILIPSTRSVFKRWLRYRFSQYMSTKTMATIRSEGL